MTRRRASSATVARPPATIALVFIKSFALRGALERETFVADSSVPVEYNRVSQAPEQAATKAAMGAAFAIPYPPYPCATSLPEARVSSGACCCAKRSLLPVVWLRLPLGGGTRVTKRSSDAGLTRRFCVTSARVVRGVFVRLPVVAEASSASRTPSSGLETANQNGTSQPDSSGPKIDISHNVKFPSGSGKPAVLQAGRD
jgi:hypothetical protein